MAITFVLADVHPLFLAGLANVFQSEADFEILASCSSGAEAIEAVRRHRPDIAMMDIRMPDKPGLTVVRQIRKEQPDCRVVILAAELDEDETVDALTLGINGIILKSSPLPSIVQGVRSVHAGEQWIEHRSAMQALEKMLRRETATRELRGLLTPREMDVTLMVTRGLHNKEVAHTLCVSEGTVKVHLHNIYEKVKVSGRLALMRYVQQMGIA